MKKLFAIMLVAMFAASFVACTEKDDLGNNSNNGNDTTTNDTIQSGTNWIVIDDIDVVGVMPSVGVKAYFDGDPTEAGVVYNTTGNPTVNDTRVDAMPYINFETGEYDYPVQHIDATAEDGSRTVYMLLTGLEPNTTYYIRAYAKLSDGNVIYSEEQNFTTESEDVN